MTSILLIREEHTDLAPFPAPMIEVAKNQWLRVLQDRMALLDQTLHHTTDDMEYGGAGAFALDIEPLEAAVDEARRMVCALGGEMRRRSEGELPIWQQPQPPLGAPSGRTISAGV